mmetsp:Transcript_152/g.450  ORF Transcript_152/g.450 Transcript_152/m.450 type:complete len:217 (+) Transcript_152:1155-1805(+)
MHRSHGARALLRSLLHALEGEREAAGGIRRRRRGPGGARGPVAGQRCSALALWRGCASELPGVRGVVHANREGGPGRLPAGVPAPEEPPLHHRLLVPRGPTYHRHLRQHGAGGPRQPRRRRQRPRFPGPPRAARRGLPRAGWRGGWAPAGVLRRVLHHAVQGRRGQERAVDLRPRLVLPAAQAGQQARGDDRRGHWHRALPRLHARVPRRVPGERS